MDWIVSALTLLQMHLIVNKKWQGWVVALVNSTLWTVLSIQREMYGLVALQLVLSVQFAFALMEWRQSSSGKAKLKCQGEVR
jgi:nicotinamide riboside transporter PnuC